MKYLTLAVAAGLLGCAASGPGKTKGQRVFPGVSDPHDRAEGSYEVSIKEDAGMPSPDADAGSPPADESPAEEPAPAPDPPPVDPGDKPRAEEPLPEDPCCEEFPPEDPMDEPPVEEPRDEPGADDPPPCVEFLARSFEPWTLELSSLFLCEAACAALLGSAEGAGWYAWDWARGPIAVRADDAYRFDLTGNILPGIYRFSYAIPSGACDARLGGAGPGGVCQDGGAWAGYRDGEGLCPEARSWIWCGETPEDGYTCSLMMRVFPDGTILPAGNQ